MTKPRHSPPPARRLALLLVAALLPALATGAEVAVLGTAHLAQLQPAASPAQQAAVVDRLARFAPTRVCIEAVPGESVEAFAADPARYGELLSTFAMNAVRLAGEQQVRRQRTAAQARAEAARLVEQASLDDMQRLTLVSLQLAAYEPWSAALNWSALPAPARESAAATLGLAATERLDAMSASDNEIATIALRLARQLGQRELCAVDPFADELGVNALADELMPRLSVPAVQQGLEALNAEQAKHWHADQPDGLLALLRWMNSDAWARADLAAEWAVFDNADGRHDAGRRRLMLWHARNAEITARLAREMAREEGGRTLLVIGAAHRPFLQASLRALPWVDVIDGEALLAP
ncbi:DUF5694 domain-containing protein [Arenimonas sp.]|uniref:DUF5694 domain-containing protein n=1 Tax=Arenimonas sp. TaxID=1872635 RepID=UPI0035B1C865